MSKIIKAYSLTGRITDGLMLDSFKAVKRNRGAAGNSASGSSVCAALSKSGIEAGLKGHLDWVQGHSSQDVGF